MIQKFILNLGFVRKAINLSSIEGTDWGKKQSDDNWQQAFDEQVEMKSKKLLSDLLGAVDERKVITYNKKTGSIFIEGKKIEEHQIMSLKAEAEYLLKSDLWQIINQTLKLQAERTMFENSTTFQDVLNGKMMLYNLSFQNNILNIFASYTPKPKQ